MCFDVCDTFEVAGSWLRDMKRGDAGDQRTGSAEPSVPSGRGAELRDREGGAVVHADGRRHIFMGRNLNHLLAPGCTLRRCEAADEDDDQAEAGDGTPRRA